ncbi:sigma-70 family RNA polymerase sigma factor [Nocardioides sp. GXQ0305]|uniref:sigma-70 family RNA polymerase sigma factor n=1 Tax=Nocardioides sp. GXQ0305 TaxID=3423912 RepID=UPI003D7C4E78
MKMAQGESRSGGVVIDWSWARRDRARGLDALRAAVASVLIEQARPAVAGATVPSSSTSPGSVGGWLLSEAAVSSGPGRGSGGYDDSDLAASSEEDEADRSRLIALVDLARTGDKEAFGLLYDHYQGAVYRFLFYRTRSTQLAEDLTSETFFRALRSMNGFRWQGKDFGAWLMTIARNLCTDHFKAGRTRLEVTTEDMGAHDDSTEGPENAVLASLTNEALMEALTRLPDEQRDCLVMRFLQGMSIAETAAVLERSDGAVKQLQLRGVRNLAKLLPEGVRG